MKGAASKAWIDENQVLDEKRVLVLVLDLPEGTTRSCREYLHFNEKHGLSYLSRD